MVVNSGGWLSRVLSYQLRERVSFPVYEEGYFTSIWEALHGGKDDILVYDRCGFLTYQLRMPYSALHYPFVESAIRVTYHGDDPCNCTLPEVETTTTMVSSLLEDGNGRTTQEVLESGLNTTMNTTSELNASSTVEATPTPCANDTDIDTHSHHVKGYNLEK